MAAYLSLACSFIYPGRDVINLTERETWTLLHYLLGSRDAPSTLANIPELVDRVMSHMHIKYRERVRQVCRIWNRVATGMRTVEEICSLTSRAVHRVPIQENTIHLGLIAGRSEYIQWARTREEFLTLWEQTRKLRYIRYFPCPQFITSAEYPQAYRLMHESVLQHVADIIEFYIWIIRLPYELFLQSPLDIEHMSYMFIPHKLYWAIAMSLMRDSRAGTLDPRKITRLYYEDLLFAISGDLRENGSRNLGLGDPKYSHLICIASQCPEIALFNWLHRGYKPNSADLEHPTLGALMIRLAATKSTSPPTDPQAFAEECRAFLGK